MSMQQICHSLLLNNSVPKSTNIENRFQEFATAMISEKPFRVEGDAKYPPKHSRMD